MKCRPSPRPGPAGLEDRWKLAEDQSGRLICVHRGDCLTYAAGRNWRSLDCTHCGAFQAPDGHDVDADRRMLSVLGSAIAGDVKLHRKPRPSDHRGEAHYASVLDESSVRQIRKLRDAGRTYSAIAREYDVSISAVSHICNRNTWAWLPDDDEGEE